MLLSSPNAKELVCRVQVVSARGDSPAFLKRGFREKFRQHPSVGVLERLLAGEKARLKCGPGGPVIPLLKLLGGRRLSWASLRSLQLHAAR